MRRKVTIVAPLRLVELVASIDGEPTLKQVDQLLGELRLMPREPDVVGIIDDLLDYRADLSAHA